MLPAAVRSVRQQPQCLQRTAARTYASAVPTVAKQTRLPAQYLASKPKPETESTLQKEGALRPHLDIRVNPNHGLYAFFRKTVDPSNGKAKYDTVEGNNMDAVVSGRSWSAKELRLKSFQDLHTLWYVLLRERNLLATQKEECRRLRIDPSTVNVSEKAALCRKSMARIKYVLNERRLAYLGADKMQKVHETKPANDIRRGAARNLRVRRREVTRNWRQAYLGGLITAQKYEASLKASGMTEEESIAHFMKQQELLKQQMEEREDEGEWEDEEEMEEGEEWVYGRKEGEPLSGMDRHVLQWEQGRRGRRAAREAAEAAKLKAAQKKEELERISKQPSSLASAGLFGEAEPTPAKSDKSS